MTDQTVELEKVRDRTIRLATELEAEEVRVDLDELIRRVAELARHIATVAHHAAGEIRNRRLTTGTP